MNLFLKIKIIELNDKIIEILEKNYLKYPYIKIDKFIA